jgi:hypothetical protein
MSKTFRHTNWVLVLLASGALVVLVVFGVLVTAHHSSSDKDQSKGATETAHSKVERTHAPRTESVARAGEPATHVSSKATHAQAKAHGKAEPGSKESDTGTQPAGKPALPDPLSSMNP